MKKIAIINNKGGVTKTSTSIHLAAYLARKRKKVLVVDFDSQRNLSKGFGVPKDYPYTVFDMMQGKSGLRLNQKKKNLFILAGSRLLDTVQFKMDLLRNRLETLEEIFENEHDLKFDYCIIDCSPSDIKEKFDDKGKLLPKPNQIALYASDMFIIPLVAEEYAIDGLQGFINDASDFKNKYHKDLKIGGVFFNIVEQRSRYYKKYSKELKEMIPDEYYINAFVPKDVRIKDAALKGESIFDIDSECRAAKGYKMLCNEILKKLN